MTSSISFFLLALKINLKIDIFVENSIKENKSIKNFLESFKQRGFETEAFHFYQRNSIFNNIFRTDEIDLTILNDAAFRFCFVVLKTGKLLYFKNKTELIDFRDQVMKNYLDFKYFRDSFDRTFLKGIGYNG